MEYFSLEYFETDKGGSPYLDWEGTLESDIRAIVRKRLNRVRLGNLGDTGPITGGIHEFRLHIGPGYRIYYVRKGKQIILLLCAGMKGSQKRDIARAIQYWEEIKEKKYG